LLFCLCHQDDIRDLLRGRLMDLAGPHAACAYLAYLVLPQVGWSLRSIPQPRPPGVTCTWPDS
jgi:hypothetical protein